MVAIDVLLQARHVRATRRARRAEAAAPTDEQLDALRLVARRGIEASLELADELETAQHCRMIEGSWRWPDPSADP